LNKSDNGFSVGRLQICVNKEIAKLFIYFSPSPWKKGGAKETTPIKEYQPMPNPMANRLELSQQN
jgi:hypothetical protein